MMGTCIVWSRHRQTRVRQHLLNIRTIQIGINLQLLDRLWLLIPKEDVFETFRDSSIRLQSVLFSTHRLFLRGHRRLGLLPFSLHHRQILGQYRDGRRCLRVTIPNLRYEFLSKLILPGQLAHLIRTDVHRLPFRIKNVRGIVK